MGNIPDGFMLLSAGFGQPPDTDMSAHLPFTGEVSGPQALAVKEIVDCCAAHDITDGPRLYAYIAWFNRQKNAVGRDSALAQVRERIAIERPLPEEPPHAC